MTLLAHSAERKTPTYNSQMQVALLITTYNWPQALALVLASVAQQTRLPDEVLVADDGSDAQTAALVARIASDFPTRLEHLWQPDLGFRLARARNLALAAARADYVLCIDGDIVLHPEFVADHLHAARRGQWIQGVRALLGPITTQRMLAQQLPQVPRDAPDTARRRHLWRSRTLSWLAPYLDRSRGVRDGVRTNQGYWRQDLLAVNGWNEEMVGWGREDNELAARLLHYGVRRRDLRFAALSYHLHHPSRKRDGDNPNEKLLDATLAQRLTRCTHGVDAHRDAFAHAIPAWARPPALGKL